MHQHKQQPETFPKWLKVAQTRPSRSPGRTPTQWRSACDYLHTCQRQPGQLQKRWETRSTGSVSDCVRGSFSHQTSQTPWCQLFHSEVQRCFQRSQKNNRLHDVKSRLVKKIAADCWQKGERIFSFIAKPDESQVWFQCHISVPLSAYAVKGFRRLSQHALHERWGTPGQTASLSPDVTIKHLSLTKLPAKWMQHPEWIWKWFKVIKCNELQSTLWLLLMLHARNRFHLWVCALLFHWFQKKIISLTVSSVCSSSGSWQRLTLLKQVV